MPATPADYEAAFAESLKGLTDRQLEQVYDRINQQRHPLKGLSAANEIHGQLIAIEAEQERRAKRQFRGNFAMTALLVVAILVLVSMCSGGVAS